MYVVLSWFKVHSNRRAFIHQRIQFNTLPHSIPGALTLEGQPFICRQSCSFPQALARDILDDILQGNEVQAAVLRFCAGLKVTSALRNLIDESFRVGTAEFFLQIGHAGIGSEPRRVGQEVMNADSHLLFAVFALPIFETGYELADRVVQT